MTSPQITITRPASPCGQRVGQGRGFSPLPVLPTFLRVPDCRLPKRQPGFLMDTFQAVAECGWRMVRGKR